MANLDWISEQNWRANIEGQQVSGLINERRIVRQVKDVNIKDLPDLVEYLRLHTSVLNKDTPEKSYSVTDPMVNGVVMTGVWRGVSVIAVEGVHSPGRTASPAGTITQVLAYGWATEIHEEEARLVEAPTMQPLGAPTYKFLTVMWPNCSNDHITAMVASLVASASFTDPVVNGEIQPGTWYNSGVTSKLANDGSGIITLQLSQQYRDIPFYPSSRSADALVETREQLGLTTETPEPMVSVDGQIKSQQISPNQDNSKNIRTSRDSGIAQTTTATVESGFDKSVTVEKTVQSVELPVPTPVSPTNHVIEQVVNKPSKYPSRFDTISKKETPIAVSTPEYIAALSERETVYRLEEKHAAAIPVIALGANDSSVSLTHDLDAFLTHNYAKTRTVKTPPIPFGTSKTWKIWEWTESATGQTFSVTLQRWWVSQWVLYHNYTEYTLQYFKTLEEARVFVNSDTGAESETLIDTTGSSFHQTGDFEYEGLKVRHKKSVLISQTYLEPTS